MVAEKCGNAGHAGDVSPGVGVVVLDCLGEPVNGLRAGGAQLFDRVLLRECQLGAQFLGMLLLGDVGGDPRDPGDRPVVVDEGELDGQKGTLLLPDLERLISAGNSLPSLRTA
jgi:hypothetical protein